MENNLQYFGLLGTFNDKRNAEYIEIMESTMANHQKKLTVYFYLQIQDEKDQILTSNVWLNLVSNQDIFHQKYNEHIFLEDESYI